MTAFSTKLRLAKATAAQWTTWNGVLANGQWGYEGDTTKVKVGNNTDNWATLPYAAWSTVAAGDITNWNSKEPAIAAGTTAQYWRGDKTFQTLNTSVVPEGSNQYFTNERVDDRVAALIQNGTGLTWTYVDGSDTLTGNVTLSPFSTTDLSEGSNQYFTEGRVRSTLLTGLNIIGGSISAADSVLSAFGKVQNQINGVLGGAIFQSVWNANTNSPSLLSGVGTKGYYYIVSVAGSTNLDGITDWKIGDWAIFDGTVWRKVDNTDAVSSVNGFLGAVSLTTTDIPEAANLYFTNGRAQSAITGGASSIVTSNLATNLALISDGSGKVAVSSVTTTELGYVSGVTSSIQTQFTNKQPLDSTLTSLAAYNTNGILTQTAADTFTGRTITGTASRISITNGNGVSGNPTIDIDSGYVGQSSITTLGTIGTGVWQGTVVGSTYGGTGVNNAGRTITVNTNSAAFTFSGAFTLTVPATGTATLGTGTANRLAYWTGTNTVADDADLLWDATNNRLQVVAGTPDFNGSFQTLKNGDFGFAHKNSTTTGFEGFIFYESSTKYAQYIKCNSAFPSNLSGSSLPNAESVQISNEALNKPIYFLGLPVIITNGVTGTNVGTRHDATGFRIGTLADLHTSNTEAFELGNAQNMKVGTTTGTKIGTATSQKLGFWGATPIIQPASANQAALTNSTGGTFDGTLVDVGLVFSQANINNNFTDIYTLLDAMRTAMVSAGLMKGAA